MLESARSHHWDRTGKRRRLAIPWPETREQEFERLMREQLFEWHRRHGWHTSARGRLVLRKWHGSPYRNGPQFTLTRQRNAATVARFGAYGSRAGHR